jgi:hypothetical protein
MCIWVFSTTRIACLPGNRLIGSFDNDKHNAYGLQLPGISGSRRRFFLRSDSVSFSDEDFYPVARTGQVFGSLAAIRRIAQQFFVTDKSTESFASAVRKGFPVRH